jgi:hypothetical protein
MFVVTTAKGEKKKGEKLFILKSENHVSAMHDGQADTLIGGLKCLEHCLSASKPRRERN